MAAQRDRTRLARGIGLITGMAALTAGAVATGLELERRVIRSVLRRTPNSLPEPESFFSLYAPGPAVTTRDGVELHVEVDEPDPAAEPGVTIVMVHGFVLSLHCWHFQRKHLRGRHKIVLYDQRSHGRSGRSAPKRCRVRFLATDLKDVLEATTAPDEPVILMGHSMGGFAIQEFARRYPEQIGTKVLGVGLLASSSGDMRQHSIIRGIPDRMFPPLAETAMAALNRIPAVVEKSRKASTDVAYVVTRRLGYGDHNVPPEYVDFLSEMVSVTPLDVISDFYPAFAEFDGRRGLEQLSRVETAVIGGETDSIIPIGHTRMLLNLLPGADSLLLPDSGHMGMIEHHRQYNDVLQRLVDRVERNLLRDLPKYTETL